MLSVANHIFLDDKLKPAQNYSKEAYCWYDTPISSVSFNDGISATKAVNKWADIVNNGAFAKLQSTYEKSTSKGTNSARRPIAGDHELSKRDRAIFASSVYLRVRWANNLFKAEQTQMDQTFKIEKGEYGLVRLYVFILWNKLFAKLNPHKI